MEADEVRFFTFETNDKETQACNTIINHYVVPAISVFCQIPVYYEVGNRQIDGSYQFTYGNWRTSIMPQVYLNGNDQQLNPTNYEIDYGNGIIKPKFQTQPNDNIMCTYQFSWFTTDMLASYVIRSLATINYAGNGAVANYTLKDLPQGWYGISADLVIAMCMENLILSYTMWVGKLIFSISANQLFDGSDNIVSQLETIKHNCEDRAYKAIDNPRLRAAYAISNPTPAYWRSISIGNGVRLSPHGTRNSTKLRGMRFNRLTGMTGPDLDI